MKTKIEKKFDAVKMMRDIRNEKDKKLESMSPKERQEYYSKRREEFLKWKKGRSKSKKD